MSNPELSHTWLALRLWAFYKSLEDAVWRWPHGELRRALCRSQSIAEHRQMELAEGSPTAELCWNPESCHRAGTSITGRLMKASTYSVKSKLGRRTYSTNRDKFKVTLGILCINHQSHGMLCIQIKRISYI